MTDKMFVIENRVTNMDNFLNDVERDLERGLYISSFRAIISMQDYMTVRGSYFTDITSAFREVIMNGTINGSSISIMDSAKISNWIENIQNQATRLNLILNISIQNYTLYQSDPWNIHIGINVTITLTDSTNIAHWNKNTYIETQLSIVGFEDPLYIIHGLGRFSNTINITPYEYNYTQYNGSVWNISNLLQHFENSFYAANPEAPSFLMRFQNNLSASPYGIESMINLQKLSSRFSPDEMTIYYDKSVVDYIYWSNNNPQLYAINFTPSWYKIDDVHRAKYNVTYISYYIYG